MELTLAGLTNREAKERLARFGLNVLDKPLEFSVVSLGLKQFTSPLMLVLTGAFGITWFLGDTLDAIVILLGLLVNASLGFWQEYRAEKSLAALNQVLARKVTVVRQSQNQIIPQEELVPGDIVKLGAGEIISADGSLVIGELQVNEAVLTGEGAEIPKKAGGKVRAGTAVVYGEGWFKVEKTGMATQIGQIAKALTRTPEAKTPLQKRLDEMGKSLTWIILIIIGLLVVLGWIKGEPLTQMVMMAVAVGVAAVPEGLAISLTAILTVGMRRILRRKALVRKLLAAEVLGSVSVICTDKTGTLTEGIMKVKAIVSNDDKIMVRAGYWAAGGIDQLESAFREWAKVMMESKTGWISKSETLLHRRPFMAEKKYSITLTSEEIFLLGAPEVLIRMAAITPAQKQREREHLERWARRGYRVVGVLVKRNPGEKRITDKLMAGKWNYVGLVVFEDRVRQHLNQVLREVESAGIEVKVITGDYPETGRAVMRQIGIEIGTEEVVLGTEIESMEPVEMERKVREAKLFARINPGQKLLIVKALQQQGEVVAMTGDGVNDAPALKQADVGIVVSSAAEVARETADMVLLDDNFATIVAAIEEGRGIYKNLRKVILYLLADSFTQILLVVGALFSGLPMILTTVQVLWINLITDTLPSMALTVDPHLLGLMDKPPRKPEESIINSQMKVLIGVISVIIALCVFGYFYWLLIMRGWPMDLARSAVFTLTAMICILIVFSCRSMLTPIWRDKIFRNGWLIAGVAGGVFLQLVAIYGAKMQILLGTVALPLKSFAEIALLCLMMIAVIEAVKFGYWRVQQKAKGQL